MLVALGKSSGGAKKGAAQEQCVLCGKLTGIRRDTPVKERKYYVETAGQLCAGCYAEIYALPHNDDILKI